MPQPVRHFRQILVWPLQLMPIRESWQIHEPWDILLSSNGVGGASLKTSSGTISSYWTKKRYSEFVTFLPYVPRFR